MHRYAVGCPSTKDRFSKSGELKLELSLGSHPTIRMLGLLTEWTAFLSKFTALSILSPAIAMTLISVTEVSKTVSQLP